MKKNVLIVSVLLLVAVAGGIYFFWQNGSNYQAPNQIFTDEQTPGEEATTPETATGNPVPQDIQISGYLFSPSALTINAGDSVTWTNMDSAPHTITSDSGSELGSGTLSNGNSYSHTFATAGTYAYHCGIHTSMKGTIVVE